MLDPISARAPSHADSGLRGTRPVLAIAAFVAAFLFAAFPFAIDDCSVLVAVPCIVASFSCSVLFMRLLIGDLGVVKWLMLGIAAWMTVVAGPQWYLVVLLTGGTVLCLFLVDRWMGNFVPLIDVSKHRRV